MLERGAPNSVCLLESGKVLPDVKVAIVHPDTKVPCAHTDLGEVCTVLNIYKCVCSVPSRMVGMVPKCPYVAGYLPASGGQLIVHVIIKTQ